jgi:hypothetical protein
MKLLLGLIIASVAFLFACQTAGDTKSMSPQEMVQKGQYLVTVSGCNDCHSTKKMTPQGPMPDEAFLLCGHLQDAKIAKFDTAYIGPGKWIFMDENLTAFVGPWGMSFTANLTPDEQTGLGLWQEDNFINAMRTGKHMGSGRAILPPMPWLNLAQAKTEDLKAIFAYLKSLTPINNLVPGAVPFDHLGKE